MHWRSKIEVATAESGNVEIKATIKKKSLAEAKGMVSYYAEY